MEQYLEYYAIYTDGSKRDERVASAMTSKYGSSSFRLPDGASIFSVEVKAISRALVYVRCSHLTKFIIYSDSLSVLQAIDNQDTKNPLVNEILEKIYNIIEMKKDLVFCWIPSHCGIPGNERADWLAKEALEKDGDPCMKLPYTDYLPAIKKFVYEKWQQRWNTQIDNKLHSIKPNLGPISFGNIKRKDQVKLSRIRLGHTRLTHSFLIVRKDGLLCAECRDVEITVHHLMIDGNKFDRHQREHLRSTICATFLDMNTTISLSS